MPGALKPDTEPERHEARDLVITGRVQGVGYRPFVYNTALQFEVTGSVHNGAGKVYIHAQGTPSNLDRLERALVRSAPPLAQPELASSTAGAWLETRAFAILPSAASGEAEIHLPPDLFTCEDCVAELTAPSERRHAYPFINCTQCGPRYTIITAMPYDRPNTSLADFPLCDDCQREYSSPADRRFHAQPLACPVCGPRLEFTRDGEALTGGGNADALALDAAVAALGRGDIIAVKGVGGYHLVCDATNDAAVRCLRERKQRPHKPLAVMFPLRGADGLDAVREAVQLDEHTASLLLDPARPIVLARKHPDSRLSPALAPGLRELGVFLPYSPLHHLLLAQFGRAVVATSGNVSGEPVLTDNTETARRLGAVADAFLHHNRPIVRPADDPVIRPMAGGASIIRLGRGIAPLEYRLPGTLEMPTLAVGGHMKNTVALAWADRVVVSPHIGDLDSPRSLAVFERVTADLQALYNVRCRQIVSDLHPGYACSRWAERQGLPLLRVQHHHAHAAALAGEHPDIDRWLVFTWDGVGFGSDGQLWGGEAFLGHPGAWRRAASFRPFQLVGGEKAGREPWRSAAALMWESGQDWSPPDDRAAIARQGWKRRLGVFTTSAAGRLFDAAAALVLGCHHASFEGQGPMLLEQCAAGDAEPLRLPLAADEAGVLRCDWEPLLAMLADGSRPRARRAHQFHVSMAQALVDQALHIHRQGAGAGAPFQAVGLSGGVFQNRLLTELVADRLERNGIEYRLHRQVPANDGGLCFGQIVEARALGETPARPG